jgi:ribosome-associated protein
MLRQVTDALVPTEKKPAKPRTQKSQDGAARPAATRAALAAKVPSGARSAFAGKAPAGEKVSAGARAPVAAKPRGSAKTPAKRPAASKTPRKPAGDGASRSGSALKSVIMSALDDMKALDVKTLDVRGLTDIADYMVIASGTSDRHVRSVAQRVVEKTKEAGFRPHGVEGLKDGDWVLVDLHETIVHIMLPRVREFYGLEKLWDLTVKRAARA